MMMKKDDVIKCRVGHEVYVLTIDPIPGYPVEASDFRGINGISDPKPGELMVCPLCEEQLILHE